ncbi:MAG: trypsin-like peptidase domain-containing protein, partial [Anaerolineae bacterium]|nr:trypsin-like peptidase domain-containing protein [Anaerolineae bacterium]
MMLLPRNPLSCMFAALLLNAMVSPAAALSPPEVFANVAPALVVLEVLDGEGRRVGSYSATRLAAGRFVTVCEVLDGAASLQLGAGPQPLPARVVARDRERNLCLLAADGDGGPTLPRVRPSAPGGRVFAVSNALGLGLGISEGVVSGVRRFSVGDYVQFTAPI